MNDTSAITVADMKAGQTGMIASIDLPVPERQRLQQLGVLEGSDIEFVRTAPGGDPIEVRILGYSLSIRRTEARAIRVDDLS